MSASVTTSRLAEPRQRFSRRRLVGLAWRTALVLLAAVGTVVGLPAGVRAPLSLAAALVVGVALLQRLRPSGLLRAATITIGGGVVALALLGIVLNLLPTGLSAAAWGVAVALLEIAVLLAVALRPIPASAASSSTPARLRPSAAAIAWTVVVLAVLGVAVTSSVVSFDATHIRPVAMAAKPASGGAVTVSVSAGSDAGPYDVVLVTGGGRSTLARNVRITPDRPFSVRVPLPAGDRSLVQLVPTGSSVPVRQLILTGGSTS